MYLTASESYLLPGTCQTQPVMVTHTATPDSEYEYEYEYEYDFTCSSES
jgi:hypothetical protein